MPRAALRRPSALALAAAVLLALLAPLSTVLPAEAGSKVVLCHRTASMTNPYRLISVAQSATNKQGHGGHSGNVWTPSWDKTSKLKWGDVIPGDLNASAGAGILSGATKRGDGKAACGYMTAAEFYAVQIAAGVPDAEIMADLQEQQANEDAPLLAALGGTFVGKSVTQLDAVKATTSAATGVTATGATLNGTISVGTKTAVMSYVLSASSDLSSPRPVTVSPSSATGDKTVTGTATGLSAATTYWFKVVGTVDPGAETEGTVEGSVLSFTTTGGTAQTITFPGLADTTYRGTAPVPAPTSSSGLPVSLRTTSPACTVSGTTVTLVAAGTCTLTASQAGNATYAPAAEVTQSFTVAKEPQTVLLPALATVGLQIGSLSVVPTGTGDVAAQLASSTPAVCTVNGTTVALHAAGPCTLTASRPAGPNSLAATPDTGSFTVTPLPLGVTIAQVIDFPQPGPVAVKDGSAPLTVSATSGLPVALAVSSGPCTVSGATVTVTAAGSCVLVAGQPGNGTYAAAADVTRTLLVVRSPQTVPMPVLADVELGSPVPSVPLTTTAGLTGVLGSATPAVCTVAGQQVTLRGVGTCTLTGDHPGDATWLPAPQATTSFEVTAVPVVAPSATPEPSASAAPEPSEPATPEPSASATPEPSASPSASPSAAPEPSEPPVKAPVTQPLPVPRPPAPSDTPAAAPSEAPAAPSPSPTVTTSPGADPSPSASRTAAPSSSPAPSPSRTAAPAPTRTTDPSPALTAGPTPSARPSTGSTPSPAPGPGATAPATAFVINRSGQVAVPATPPRDGAPLARTTATLSSRNGVPAPPVAALKGGQLRPGQAATLSGRILFDFDSPRLTKAGLAEVKRLVGSLQASSLVVCEGYADYGGAVSHEKQLSAARASTVCATIAQLDREVRGSGVGYGHVRPVVVGGSREQRAENRRVVVVVKK